MKQLVLAFLAVVFVACAATVKRPRIDLDVRDASMHEAFRAIATAAHVNFDVDPEVEGSVTIAVHGQPWDEVVARIAREHHLRVEEVRGVVYVSDAARPARERPAFHGAKITVAFDETPLREAVAELAHAAQQAIVVDDDVADMRVTMRVRDVPWDQALEHLARKEGLSVVREGNAVRVRRENLVPAGMGGR